MASIAALLRRLHDAARGFDAGGHDWSDELADPAGGTLVCHNDVCPENVVFRDGIAVALIDFGFAAPGRPVYDLDEVAESLGDRFETRVKVSLGARKGSITIDFTLEAGSRLYPYGMGLTLPPASPAPEPVTKLLRATRDPPGELPSPRW